MAAATMYVTVAGAGDKSGSSWANAMGYAEWEADLEANVEAGDIYYIEEGTYTLTSNLDWNLRNGINVAPICVIGVASGTTNEPPVLADWATGSARPLIACGGNYVYTGDFCKVFNVQFTATGTYGLLIKNFSVAWNCKGSGSATYTFTLQTGTGAFAINSEFTSIGGNGVYSRSNGGLVIFCYIHDSVNGILINIDRTTYLFNIIDTCSGDGLSCLDQDSVTAVNNTIYNCGNGIAGTVSNNGRFINNIINDCIVGLNWTTQVDSNVWINNNLEGNDTKSINVATALPHSDWLETIVDPQFMDGAGGDFSLQPGSECLDAGLAIALGVG